MGGRSVNAGMELHLLFEEFFSGKKISLYIMDHGQQVTDSCVCVCAHWLSCIQLSVTPWTVAH